MARVYVEASTNEPIILPTINQRFEPRYREAMEVASFVLQVPMHTLQKSPKYKELRARVVQFALSQHEHNNFLNGLATTMLVSALLLTIAAALLLNPPGFASFSDSSPPSSDSPVVRVFFYSAFLSVVLYMLSICAGTVVSTQYNMVRRDSEIPVFLWKLNRLVLLNWTTLIAGILTTGVMTLVLIWICFTAVEFWVAFGLCVVLTSYFGLEATLADKFWTHGVCERIAEHFEKCPPMSPGKIDGNSP
eukprot:RCo054976